MKNKDVYLEDFVRKSLIEEDGGVDFMKEHGIGDYFNDDKPMINYVAKLLVWFQEEYQEHITLTDDEKVILRSIDKKWKWLVKDKNGVLLLYEERPPKIDNIGWCGNGFAYRLSIFSHLFFFVKWEDEEPYNIDELLKQNGVER